MSSDPRDPASDTAANRVRENGPATVYGWQTLPIRLADGIWARIFPFLRWFPIGADVLRADLIAGMIGALVLVPKAMAYAQLSGLPVYFGLYAAFIPAILGALWGSSRQLPARASGASAEAVISEITATGPVNNWRELPHSAPRIAGMKAAYRPK